MKIDKDIEQQVKTIWDYLVLDQPLVKADCILVFGGHDPSVAIHAAELYKNNWANTIFVSGGITHPASFYGETEDCIEAKALQKILLKRGVPNKSIVLETKAKNTSENFWFTADILVKLSLPFKKFILVQKPYTERRTYLTGLNRWPDKEIIVSSIKTTFQEYFNCGIPQEKIIDMVVGEIYRIQEYPNLGYFSKQTIPENVCKAYTILKDLGFDKRIK